MVKDILKDAIFLSQKAEKATEKDKYIAEDIKNRSRLFENKF